MELGQRISTLHQILNEYDDEYDLDITFVVAANSTDLADTILYQPREATERRATAGSPNRLRAPDTGAAKVEEHWLLQGTKPRNPITSTPVLQGACSMVGVRRAVLLHPAAINELF